MRFATIAPLLTLVAVDTAGCASRRAQPATGSADRASAHVLTVRNDYWLDVAVYVVNGSTRFRIGTVVGISTETFRLTEAFETAGSVQLLIDPIGTSRSHLTEAITVTPGQRIDLKVREPLSQSTVAVSSQ